MFPKSVLVVILVLALVSMACGISIDLPNQELTTTSTQTMPIVIPAPSSEPVDLTLNFGAGELKIAPGAVNALVDGTATYNVEKMKPVITVEGAQAQVSTGNLEARGLPSVHVDNLKNVWDLKLGSQLMHLKINAGAYQGRIELGGLALQNLEVNDGAADVEVAFSQANTAEMDHLVYTTGASNVSLRGLANANFSTLTFRSGLGQYTLDFSGQLTRDANVMVESGASKVIIIVPQGVSATVSVNGGLSNVTTNGEWQQSGSSYVSAGSGPQLNISVTLGAGEIELRNTP
jgi:hypothetical protein